MEIDIRFKLKQFLKIWTLINKIKNLGYCFYVISSPPLPPPSNFFWFFCFCFHLVCVWEISRTSYLSALESQARTVLFSSDISFLLRFNPFLGSLWILSHIGKKCTPCMPYKLLGKGMVYHYFMPLPKSL